MKISVFFRSKVSVTDFCLLIELIYPADGLENRNLVNITLPRKDWIWEGGWQSKLEREGQQLLSCGKLVDSNTARALINFFPTLDSQGWTFTHGFPCNCSAAKAYITCVRWKEGVCHRQFNSQFWSMLQLVTMEDIRELFSDTATGGFNRIGAASLYLPLYGY
jgi:hypothetical protein